MLGAGARQFAPTATLGKYSPDLKAMVAAHPEACLSETGGQ